MTQITRRETSYGIGATVALVGRKWRGLLVLGVLLAGWSTTPIDAADDEPTPAARAAARAKSKYRDFSDVTEGAKKYQGLFNMYEVDGHLYAEIRPQNLNQMYLAPIAIARGIASAGTPLNFGDEWVLSFKRVGDTIQLIRKNIHYEAPKGTPLARAVEQNYMDSVLMALPIVSINPSTQGALIDFSSIFMSDFAGLGLGAMDRSRSSWHKIKAFENNVELEVEATFGSRFSSGESFGDDGVVDPRGITVVIHYSLAKRPGPGYRERIADQRIGHFINATKDFGAEDPDTTFVRRINRWRLEKANPQAKLSPPKQQLVWWVENTVPHEYRPYVEEGILEWNKAFEKIGFRNAIGVRWQNEQDEFDPEDINYCTFRWITTPSTYAMSGLRADPITGEMIDGDVIFDASWIRAWKQEYAFLVGAPIPTGSESYEVLNVGEIISPMMAAKAGYGLPLPRSSLQRQFGVDETRSPDQLPLLVPGGLSPIGVMLNQRLATGRLTNCQYAGCRHDEYALAAMVLAARQNVNELEGKDGEEKSDDKDDKSTEKKEDGDDANDKQDANDKDADSKETADKDGEKKDAEEKGDDDKDDKKDDKKKPVDVKLPEELIGQAIKEVVMHEVGHSLGLRHNFKASAMLSLDEINDPKITREKGLAGSVMDYNPLNIAKKGQTQGDYASTTLGPYDYWAIEYAYKPISGSEEKELKQIASRSPEPDLVYATDEDLRASNDPLVNAYDMGNDVLRYAKERISLAQELLQNLDETVVRDGESWARLRLAFNVLFNQYGNGAHMATGYIGGESFSRDFKGSKDGRDPIVPIAGDKQREALDYLIANVLSDAPFKFKPEILRRLTTEHWYHWGSNMSTAGVGYNVYDRVLAVQRIALQHCLSSSVLRRVQNQQLMVDPDSKPLEIAEVFRKLTDGIWSELQAQDGKVECSLIRRNLQRDYLQRLCRIVIGESSNSSPYAYLLVIGGSGGSYPADARSIARMHLIELQRRLENVTTSPSLTMDEATKAHFAESKDLITKVLAAEVVAGQP
ncbi:MAG: zinc-dependent metalloprotease [Planctomycetales bacterium]|nr:zinc-dependent metalloprotease [Planctomycetales bacterium]MCA9168740.1 zinc-dependent metalloprotease [Planctomycetales bacterium]